MKHPRDMTETELRTLPSLNRIPAGGEHFMFKGEGGSMWEVGLSGQVWCRAWLRDGRGDDVMPYDLLALRRPTSPPKSTR